MPTLNRTKNTNPMNNNKSDYTMPPRKRTANRPDVPNLRVYEKGENTYYSWANPNTGKTSSLQAKNDRKLAMERAIELNKIVAKERADTVVTDILKKRKRNLNANNDS